MRPARKRRGKLLKSGSLKERGLILGDVIGLAHECVFKNGFHEVIGSKVQGRFLDLAFILKLHLANLDLSPMAGHHPAIRPQSGRRLQYQVFECHFW